MRPEAKHYKILLLILIFYLFAQIFQQVILRSGLLASGSGLEAAIISGQNPLNIIRLFLILLSMFLMVAGYLIITLHFYEKSPLLSILAFIFFFCFCLFEIGYRSVELFQVGLSWGKEFAAANPADRGLLLTKFRLFNDVVEAIYFPLLFSQLIASVCLLMAAAENVTGKLIMMAMSLNSVRLLLRLSAFTPFDFLNVFSGGLYFPPVALIFVLLILWTIRIIRQQTPQAD